MVCELRPTQPSKTGSGFIAPRRELSFNRANCVLQIRPEQRGDPSGDWPMPGSQTCALHMQCQCGEIANPGLQIACIPVRGDLGPGGHHGLVCKQSGGKASRHFATNDAICCSILVGLPLGVLGRLDRVLRSAARLIGRIPKFGSVSAYMRDVLHWLPVAQRISYRIASLVSRSILGCAPSYLRNLCRPVSDVVARRALRSATTGQLLVPRARLTARQRRAFSVAGPSIWNDLPSELRLLPLTSQTGFYKSLKSFYFCRGWAGSASE